MTTANCYICISKIVSTSPFILYNPNKNQGGSTWNIEFLFGQEAFPSVMEDSSSASCGGLLMGTSLSFFFACFLINPRVKLTILPTYHLPIPASLFFFLVIAVFASFTQIQNSDGISEGWYSFLCNYPIWVFSISCLWVDVFCQSWNISRVGWIP